MLKQRLWRRGIYEGDLPSETMAVLERGVLSSQHMYGLLKRILTVKVDRCDISQQNIEHVAKPSRAHQKETRHASKEIWDRTGA